MGSVNISELSGEGPRMGLDHLFTEAGRENNHLEEGEKIANPNKEAIVIS